MSNFFLGKWNRENLYPNELGRNDKVSESFDKSFTEIYDDDSKSSINEDIDFLSSNQSSSINPTNVNQIANNPVFTTTKRIHKMKIFGKTSSEIKKNFIKEVRKFGLKYFSNGTSIIVEIGLGDEDPQQNRTESIESHKNLPKILGVAIISFANDKKNVEYIENLIKETKRIVFFANQIRYEPKIHLSLRDFHEWIQTEELKTKFVNLKAFRDIWGFMQKSDSLGLKKSFYYCILTEISKHFMENEFIQFIFRKVSEEKIMKKHAICYLEKIPVFMRGLHDPENLRNIS